MLILKVPVENFEKLKLSLFYDSEPLDLEVFFEPIERKLRKEEFFKNSIPTQNLNWCYFDKYEDISIYFLKNELNAMGKHSEAFSQISPQNQPNFNEKLRLWKCCTLIKKQNVTFDKILQRINYERYIISIKYN